MAMAFAYPEPDKGGRGKKGKVEGRRNYGV
jgi:hypothetical protein